jgi:hypothetical protein
MNRESSRSHCVLTCSIRSESVSGGIRNILSSRLNLVDLAGSEQQKASGASGERLREASNINKSLSILGRVINSLASQQRTQKLGQHIPYRDSKLTFLLQVVFLSCYPPIGERKPLCNQSCSATPPTQSSRAENPFNAMKINCLLPQASSLLVNEWRLSGAMLCDILTQDSLGGNSKTVMIANISPSAHNIAETQSTLRFAQRAKKMGNRAIVNENTMGDNEILRKEVVRLKRKLEEAQKIIDAKGASNQWPPSFNP